MFNTITGDVAYVLRIVDLSIANFPQQDETPETVGSRGCWSSFADICGRGVGHGRLHSRPSFRTRFRHSSSSRQALKRTASQQTLRTWKQHVATKLLRRAARIRQRHQQRQQGRTRSPSRSGGRNLGPPRRGIDYAAVGRDAKNPARACCGSR